jgi:hypothetical protein
MKIKKGDIFVRDSDGQVYIVEQVIGRVVYLTTICKDGAVVPGLTYFRTSVERYFTKLTI